MKKHNSDNYETTTIVADGITFTGTAIIEGSYRDL